MKLANRQAGYLSSLSLIRAYGTQRATCSARLSATADQEHETQRMRSRDNEMERDEKPSAKRRQHLRVPVFPEEKALIEANAKKAGVSVARYLRDVGQGYQVRGIMDYEYVRELVRVNGDLGRLGGLLKLWLTDDARTALFSAAMIQALLGRIENNQEEMSRLMKSVVQPRAEP